MKVVVIDDDPTGSQTVHDCLLLLSWDVDALRQALHHHAPIFFVLANTRALLPHDVEQRIKEICTSLKKALKAEGLRLEDILLVSRGDSTLRGHGFLEPKLIATEMGSVAATFHVPAFFEGQRTTVEGLHLLNGEPIHKTVFAKDRVFGYSTSYLPAWIEEKSKGEISLQKIKRIGLRQLESANTPVGMESLITFLRNLDNNTHVVVDAQQHLHLKIFAEAIENVRTNKLFLFRSAASLLNSFSGINPIFLKKQSLKNYRRRNKIGEYLPGMILVGSHISLSTNQLTRLLEDSNCVGLELSVQRILDCFESKSTDVFLANEINYLCFKVKEIFINNQTPVLYTSRKELTFSSLEKSLSAGKKIAKFMALLVQSVLPQLGYLISKGGTTTQTLLREGLGLDKVRLEGQLFAGLSLVIPLQEEQKINLPIVTFPGNLGSDDSLFFAWKLLESS